MIDLSPFQLAILILATWQLAYMLLYKDGLFGVFIAVRKAGARVGLTELFACIYCMSVWVSAVHLALVLLAPPDLLPVVWLYLHWLAISGGVSLAHRATAHD
jgi:hypothetical protein